MYESGFPNIYVSMATVGGPLVMKLYPIYTRIIKNNSNP